MAGHSKWAKIKHKKGANDAKRGALFTKLGKNITVAASEGGGDVDMNFTLRLAVEKAKQANMPMANIEKAIKKGTGELEGGTIQKIVYEGVGPAGSALVVTCSTDNTNRTVAELRRAFEAGGGNLGSSGSTAWQFTEMGVVDIRPAKLEKSEKFGQDDSYKPVDIEELELELLEIDGVQDLIRSEDDEGNKIIEVRTDKSDFGKVHKAIEAEQIQIDTAELRYVPNDPISVSDDDQEKVLKLMDNLDDNEDVDNVFVNVNLD